MGVNCRVLNKLNWYLTIFRFLRVISVRTEPYVHVCIIRINYYRHSLLRLFPNDPLNVSRPHQYGPAAELNPLCFLKFIFCFSVHPKAWGHLVRTLLSGASSSDVRARVSECVRARARLTARVCVRGRERARESGERACVCVCMRESEWVRARARASACSAVAALWSLH